MKGIEECREYNAGERLIYFYSKINLQNINILKKMWILNSKSWSFLFYNNDENFTKKKKQN